MKQGWVKIACASPDICVADVRCNLSSIESILHEADALGCNLLVLPELSLTGATCGDLFRSEALARASLEALQSLAQASAEVRTAVVVGLPMQIGGRLLNAQAVLANGQILGIVANRFPLVGPFDAADEPLPDAVKISCHAVPLGSNLVFRHRVLANYAFAVLPNMPVNLQSETATSLCHSGAAILLHPVAVPTLVSSFDQNREWMASLSRRLSCGIASANAGVGESTQNAAYGGELAIFERGKPLADSPAFSANRLIVSEVDVDDLVSLRRGHPDLTASNDTGKVIYFDQEIRVTSLTRKYSPHPFIADTAEEQRRRTEEILQIQSHGLARRMAHTGSKSMVVGVSGGLDSALALLVAHRTAALLGLAPSSVQAVSMPCFGTTKRTRGNAQILCESLGVSFREIDISDSVRQHLRDLGHDDAVHDAAYENSQARQRTMVLMDLANMINGLVVGTGDLSELALGWATYNGDHMSMYGVNAGIPKTLIRSMIANIADASEPALANVLRDILDTPVSPELLPADSAGAIAQKTEDLVGPYELHDFFLYWVVRHGFGPAKVYRMACGTFDGVYDAATVHHWLRVFLRRFFQQQFKRSCLPDGPKVGSVSLSPRGDWNMPSDACWTVWQEELDAINP